MKDTWIKIGYVANTHGIRGDVKVESLSDVEGRLLRLEEVYAGDDKQKLRIVSAKDHKGMTLLRFSDHEDINRALPFKGSYLYVREEDAEPLPADSWYHFQLIGLRAVHRKTGETLGTVTDVLETYANEVLQIEKEDGAVFLVPFVHAFVGEVSPENATIEIDPIEGME